MGDSAGAYSLVYRLTAPSAPVGAVPGPTHDDTTPTPHALTVDLEDWHQLFFRQVTGASHRASQSVVADTDRILELLAESGTHATFFVVGLVAAAFPELIRRVAAAGHEIGCHTSSHEVLGAMEPSAFKADAERSRALLQDLCGQPVLSFRAPAFSVGSLHNEPFFSTLAETGFECDSSVFPVAGLRYGIPDAPPHPFVVETASGPIHEFPWRPGACMACGCRWRAAPRSGSCPAGSCNAWRPTSTPAERRARSTFTPTSSTPACCTCPDWGGAIVCTPRTRDPWC